MKRVLVLGSTGMLGSGVSKFLSTREFETVEANREGRPTNPKNQAIHFEALDQNYEKISSLVQKFDYIVNCIGIIKHKLESSEEAFKINGEFPNLLAKAAGPKCKIIQVATDCVFAGATGLYTESSNKDATDLYGKSKIIGEVNSNNFMNVRCSIVGTEISTSIELFDWVYKSPQSASLTGYTNHIWNGLTSLSFARILDGLMKSETFIPGTYHVVPADLVSKFDLISMIANSTDRSDIEIRAGLGSQTINRSLSTDNPTLNEQLWKNAGYKEIPTVKDMIQEYSEWIG